MQFLYDNIVIKSHNIFHDLHIYSLLIAHAAGSPERKLLLPRDHFWRCEVSLLLKFAHCAWSQVGWKYEAS